MVRKEIYSQVELYNALDRFVGSDKDQSSFTEVYLEKSVPDESTTRSADIFVESTTKESLVIEVKRDDKYLLHKDRIIQARDYAQSLGHSTFALADSQNFFLFDYNGEMNISDIDFYYLNFDDYDLEELTPKILHAVESLFDRGQLPNQIEKERIIGLLRTFHSYTYPVFKTLAQEKYGVNRQFNDAVDNWADENGYTDHSEDELFDILSKQYTYALVNRLLFYKLLKDNNIDDEYDTVVLDEIDLSGNSEGLQARVESQFKKVTEHINYEPIFNIQNEVFEQFPSNKRTDKDLQNLLKSFQNIDITEINEDFLGDLYQELIPSDERKALGQFYTPPSVAEAITKWTLDANTDRSDDDLPRVLDPACGSGTFPVEAYKYMENTYGTDHQEIIDKISVVDVNKFPLHLTGLNLTSRNISEPTNHIDSFHGSFFDYPDPDETGKYDAVIGNPPYISSGDLYPDTEHFRKHLKQYNPDGNKVPEYYEGTKRFSKRSDAYIYFITNALRYLKEGGRLGVIIPTRWMETKYGEDFQQFLFDNTAIHSVVTFSSRVFEDAEVSTSILLIEKTQEVEEQVIDFIKIKNTVNPDELVNTIQYSTTISGDYTATEMESYSIISVKQKKLQTKIGNFHYLPNIPHTLLEITESNNMTTLNQIVDVYRGTTTGKDAFFCLSDEDINHYGIEEVFLSIAATSGEHLETGETDSESIDNYILDMEWFVTDRNISDIQELKQQLTIEGYTGILKYITHGEDKNYHKTSTANRRDIWCVLSDITKPDIIHRKMISKNFTQSLNTDDIAINNNYYGLDTEDPRYIHAITNSYLYKIFMELWGLNSISGSIQLHARSLKLLPFPKLEEMTTTQKQQLKKSSDNICNGEYHGLADEVILKFLGIDDITAGELKNIFETIVTARVEEIDYDILIENEDTVDEIDIFEDRSTIDQDIEETG
jgi:type I restriction-modification system DNA methylase subunit